MTVWSWAWSIFFVVLIVICLMWFFSYRRRRMAAAPKYPAFSWHAQLLHVLGAIFFPFIELLVLWSGAEDLADWEAEHKKAESKAE